MPKMTSNPIDAERNTKERLRNQSLQKTICAIGVEVGMAHLRKQDFLEEALRQLKEYHRMTPQPNQIGMEYLEATVKDLSYQLQRANQEITRLQGMLNSAPAMIQMEQRPIVGFQAMESQQGVQGNDFVDVTSKSFREAEMFLETVPQHPPTHQSTVYPFPSASSQKETLQTSLLEEHRNINEFRNELVVDSASMPSVIPSVMPSNVSQATDEVLPSEDVVFGDSLAPAEIEMLKDFQEPDVDLLLGDSMDFFDFEEDAVPTWDPLSDTINDLSPSHSNHNYDIIALLADTQFS